MILDALLTWVDQRLQVSAFAEHVWASLLLWAFTGLFRGPLGFVQDVILSVPWLEDQVVRALLPRYRGAVVAQAPPPDTLAALDYYVDPAARQTLQHAALAALSVHLQADEVLAPAQLLPQVGRVLLTTEEAPAGHFLEAVAAALASEMNAGLVRVDAMLLATLAAETFGCPPEEYLAAFGGGSGSTRVASGGPVKPASLRLAWRALREVLYELERPTVVYVRHAERLLGSSREAREAFSAAFGADDALALAGAAARAPLVLLAGARLVESPAGRAGAGRPGQGPRGGDGGDSSSEEEEGGGTAGRRRGGGLAGVLEGDDDDLGLADLLRGLSQLAGESRRPDPRRLLLQLFPTRVKLLPPPAGAAAARHRRRVAADAAEEAEEENYRAAAAVAASTGVTIPPKRSGIYATGPGGRPLSRGDWGKALSWAVALQTLEQRRRQAAAAQARQGQRVETGQAPGRRRLAPDAGPWAALQPLPGVLWRGASLRRWATSLASLWRSGVALACCAAAVAAPPFYLLPLVGGWLERALEGWRHASSGEQAVVGSRACSWTEELADDPVMRLVRELEGHKVELQGTVKTAHERMLAPAKLMDDKPSADVDQELEMLGHRSPGRRRSDASERGEAEADASDAEADAGADAAEPGEAGADAEASSDGGGGGTLRLGEQAVRYGLRMAARSGGGVQARVEPANAYERQLLGEVLSPEDCGRGFSGVGALQQAKQALREAVQLPLQHPELFAGAALARPSKGVLLFGPPGTGKTLVARAAAAECGAAFLAINPSAVASKYFGDSVKFVRAAFSLAARLSPCVLFFDEVDALLGRRNASREHEAMREMKNELMAQWDGIQGGQGRIVVLGATNRPFDLDEAALRRFTHRVFVGLPDAAAREAILRVVLEGERLGPGVEMEVLAERTPGFSGSDLRQLCVAAAMRPVRQLLERDSVAGGAAGAAAQAKQAVEEGEDEGASAGAKPEDKQRSSSGSGRASSRGHLNGEAEAGRGRSRAASIAGSASERAGSSEQAPAAPLSLVPRLDSLLRQARGIAAQPPSPRAELRPITMQDFEAALREVGPSVDPDSQSVQELGEWNRQWGTGGGRSSLQDRRLTYFT